MSGTILPLCPSSARLMLVSGAEEDPLAWSSWRRAVRHGAVERSGEEGTVLGRQLLCGWNLPEALVAPFPNSVLRPSAESAWSRLGFHWRSVWTDGADSDLRRWFYLFGRAMSLRLLLERGELVPVFPLSRLAHRYGEAFHGEARGAAERVLSASSLSGWADSAEFFSGIFSVRFEKKSAAIRIC